MYRYQSCFSFKNAIKEGSVSGRYRDEASNPDSLNKGLTARIDCHTLRSSDIIASTSLVAIFHIMVLLYSCECGFTGLLEKSWIRKWDAKRN
ncbi:hypothetical protein FCV25MIE_27522 [Fagus crenata]